jgi:hypothetical protein
MSERQNADDAAEFSIEYDAGPQDSYGMMLPWTRARPIVNPRTPSAGGLSSEHEARQRKRFICETF